MLQNHLAVAATVQCAVPAVPWKLTTSSTSAYDLFDTDKIITKIPLYAIERQEGFEKSGFTKSEEFMIGTNDKYAYKDYWEKSKQ